MVKKINKYANKYYHNKQKYTNNKCKKCGKNISRLNKGKNKSQRRVTCKDCGNRGMRGEYIFRVIGKYKDNRKDIYGVTVPQELVEKFNLLGKKFKIRTGFGGKLILYTQINEKNKKQDV